MADLWNQSHRLYVAEFKCGVIKVGQTKQQGDRRRQCLRFKGEAPVRFFLGLKHEHGWLPERNLINAAGRMGAVVRGREWFTGIRFEQARQLVLQITRNVEQSQRKP